MSVQIRKLKQIAIVVNDVPAMAAFYESSLGIKKLFDAPGMSFFDLNGVRLMLSLPSNAGVDKGNSILYFDTANIEQSTDQLKAKGVSFEREPFMVAKMPDHEFWLAFFRDPEQNLLALSCEKPLK